MSLALLPPATLFRRALAVIDEHQCVASQVIDTFLAGVQLLCPKSASLIIFGLFFYAKMTRTQATGANRGTFAHAGVKRCAHLMF
jgi:hypothetical protein